MLKKGNELGCVYSLKHTSEADKIFKQCTALQFRCKLFYGQMSVKWTPLQYILALVFRSGSLDMDPVLLKSLLLLKKNQCRVYTVPFITKMVGRLISVGMH